MLSLLRKFVPWTAACARSFRDDRRAVFARMLSPGMISDGNGGRASFAESFRRRRGKDSVLPFEKGELPNVIQFLTMSSRTGQLHVEFPQSDAQGNMFIREGQVYAIYFGPDIGLEALAAMCNGGCGSARFLDGQQVTENNVDLPATSLLVEAVVRADERLSEGVDAPPADLSLADLETESEVRDYHSTESFMTGLMLMAKVGAVIGVFAAAFIANYYGYETLQEIRERREIEEQRTEQQKHELRLQAMRREAVKRWYGKAKQAYREKNYPEAANLLEITLRIDTDYGPARQLAGNIGEARSRLLLIPLQSQAEVAMSRLTELKQGQGFGERIEELNVKMKSARALKKAEEYSRATELFETIIRDAEELEVADQQRADARAERDEVVEPRLTASREKAPLYAAVRWEQAQHLDTAAMKNYNEGQFQKAVEQWRKAAAAYRDATQVAEKQEAVQTARIEFRKLFDNEDNAAVMQEYAGDTWRDVRRTVEEAQKLTHQGRKNAAREKWEVATATFNAGLKEATARRHRVQYETWVQTGRRQLETGAWEKARQNFENALAVVGDENSEAARQGLQKAKLQLALSNAREALTEGHWTAARNRVQYALKIDPDNETGRKLLADIDDRLTPRLTVQTLVDGKTSYDTRVTLEADEKSYPAPVTFKLKRGRFYALTVTAPPDGYVYYEPQHLRYHANEPGPDLMSVRLERMSAPTPGSAQDVPGLHIDLAPVAPGSFRMGAADGRRDERPMRLVKLSQPFWVAKYEVTNGDYRAFLEDSGYEGADEAASGYLKHFTADSTVPDSDQHPVCYVSWKNADAFCQWLTRREHKGGRLPDGYVYRLPTEAEWEYACRAGTTGDFAGNPVQMAHFARNVNEPKPVGTRLPNKWGIFDMHGNMWEMCYDTYAAYEQGDQTNPVQTGTGHFRVVRGGGWTSVRQLCRSAYRSNIAPVDIRRNLGFRVVLAPEL